MEFHLNSIFYNFNRFSHCIVENNSSSKEELSAILKRKDNEVYFITIVNYKTALNSPKNIKEVPETKPDLEDELRNDSASSASKPVSSE
jgi:hypothetical protein